MSIRGVPLILHYYKDSSDDEIIDGQWDDEKINSFVKLIMTWLPMYARELGHHWLWALYSYCDMTLSWEF